MTNLDLPGIAKKLAGISKRLDRLMQYKSLSIEDYLLDEDRQILIERLLELIIQASLDINKMILKAVINIDFRNNENAPLTNADIFRLVGQHGIIPPDLADKLTKAGQFRNLLAHLYDDIDPRQVYVALQKSLEQYPAYIEAIQDYIDALEIDDDDRRTN